MTALTLEVPLTPERRRPRFQLRQAAQEERTHAQEARAYAERWYQALMAWDVQHGRVPVPSNNYTDFRNRMHGGISTLGEFLPDRPAMLGLPSGEYLEGEVSLIIQTMLLSGAFEVSENGHLLDTLRDQKQRKPATLLREDRRWMRQTSPAWALAVLSLAVQLRDGEAQHYIAYCRREFERAARQRNN